MKKVLHEKSVHEKSVSFVISQKNLFVLKISKKYLFGGGGGGAGGGAGAGGGGA
jgi:uncharacterized membrane protein